MTRTVNVEKCSLFAGLGAAQLRPALDFFRASEYVCARGELLNSPGAPLDFFGLVLRGRVEVCTDDIEGSRMLMASVGEGGTFGESLAYLGADAQVYIVADSGTRILRLHADRLREPTTDPLFRLMSERFTAMLARRTLEMNERIQILSKHTMRAKLIAFFTFFSRQAGSDSFELPMSRESMALYIGADRSALSRELSEMKRAGLIDFDRNRFIFNRDAAGRS